MRIAKLPNKYIFSKLTRFSINKQLYTQLHLSRGNYKIHPTIKY
jgi:hypothetical protein